MTYEECHKEIDGILHKLCNKCNEWLPCSEEYFYKNKNKNSLFPYCKKCSINKAKKRTYENYDKHLESLRKNNSRPEVKKKVSEAGKIKREKGIQRKWQQENKDKIKEYQNKRKMNKKHKISKEEWKDCKNYFNNSCAYCGMSEKQSKETFNQSLHKEHVDHNGSNGISNCVPACKSCNSKKWERPFLEWYNENNDVFNLERLNKINEWINNDYAIYIKEKQKKVT